MEKSKEARSKAEVIRAFLDHHQPKLPEARGFLQFLLAKDEILRRLVIVDDLDGCEAAILVSAKGSGTWPFFYRYGNRFYHKTSQAVVELMKFVPEPLYLRLSTEPPPMTPEREEFLRQLATWQEEIFMEEVRKINRRQELLSRIDAALAAGDRAAFMRYSEELRRL
ncbi:MAG: YpiB family protein [Bacillota bacterium]|nr:MAG: hypothetical protein DIU70_08000 [Bacillota bacterium]